MLSPPFCKKFSLDDGRFYSVYYLIWPRNREKGISPYKSLNAISVNGYGFKTTLSMLTECEITENFINIPLCFDRACIGIGVCFIVSSFGIFSRTVYLLLQQEMPEKVCCKIDILKSLD